MKKYSEKIAATVCARLLKSARLDKLKSAWIDKHGDQCFTDGVRAYRLKNHLKDIPMLPDGMQGINLDAIFNPIKQRNQIEIPAPDIEKIQSLKRDYIYCISNDGKKLLCGYGEGYPVFNGNYLLDLARLFPDGKWYIARDILAPIYVVSPHGTGTLFPFRAEGMNSAVLHHVERPKTILDAPCYFIYYKRYGQKNFAPLKFLSNIDIDNYKPFFMHNELEQAKKYVEQIADDYTDIHFRICNDSFDTIYEPAMCYTPATFNKIIGA